MVDFSQKHIKSQLAEYLKQRQRDPELIEKLTKQGFCRGFTTLNLYAKWLETQPIRKDKENNPIPRDDFTWLKHALTVISTWNQKTFLSAKEEECFEHVLAKINAYQGMCDLLDIQQADLHLSFSDTRDRACVLEYDLGVRYTSKELMECIGDLLPENKLIFIESHNHSMGMIKQGEIISYINPNLKKGMVDLSPLKAEELEQHLDSLDEQTLKLYWQITHVFPLVILFFASSNFSPEKPSPITIQVFGIEENNVQQIPEFNYPPRSCFLEKSSILKMSYSYDLIEYANGETELHQAVDTGNKEIIDYLLTQPIAKDINYIQQENSRGLTPLLLAVARNSPDIITTLLKSGAQINFENKDGNTPLNTAVQFKNMEMVDFLLKLGANVNHVNRRDLLPLSFAGRLNLVLMIHLLIQEGADINLISSDGMTALAHATGNNSVEAANVLLEYGSICTGYELYLAIRNHLNELIPKFIKRGANLHNALMHAAQDNDLETVKELITLGAKCPQAYILAIESGSTKAMKHLLQYEETQLFKQECGLDALLLFAAQSKQGSALMKLLSPNIAPQEGWMSWLIPAKKQGVDIVALGVSLSILAIDKILKDGEKNQDSILWRFFSSDSHEKKLQAADAIAVSLNNIDDPSSPNNLLPYKKVLLSSLNNLYEIYQAIYHIQTGIPEVESRLDCCI